MDLVLTKLPDGGSRFGGWQCTQNKSLNLEPRFWGLVLTHITLKFLMTRTKKSDSRLRKLQTLRGTRVTRRRRARWRYMALWPRAKGWHNLLNSNGNVMHKLKHLHWGYVKWQKKCLPRVTRPALWRQCICRELAHSTVMQISAQSLNLKEGCLSLGMRDSAQKSLAFASGT